MCVKHIFFAIVIISLEEKLPCGRFYETEMGIFDTTFEIDSNRY